MITVKRLWLGLMISVMVLCQVNNGYCTVQWKNGTAADTPPGDTNPGDIDDVISDNIVEPLDNFLADGRFKCQLAYSSATTLTVGKGSAVCSNTAGTIRLMARNASSTSVTFSDLDTGAEEASKTYYVYAIMSAVSDTVFTIKISLSSSLPTGVTYYQRLGYFTNDASSNISNVIDDSSINPIPAGSIQMYGAATAPAGWLICDGSAISRTTYSTLYAVISTTFGTGNGSTTFNLPNFTNRFPYGSSTGTSAGNSDVGSSRDRTEIAGNDSSVTCIEAAENINIVGGNTSQGAVETMPSYLSIYFLIKT